MKNCKTNLIKIVVIFMLICIMFQSISFAEITVPTENQYMELKLAKITDIDGKDKQVIMELWAHNIEIKGADVRFEYDSSKLKPSNINTNEFEYDYSIFEFESIFKDRLDNIIIDDGTDVVRMAFSILLGEDENAYYKKKSDGTYYIDATSDVLIGKMSFRLFDGKIDDNTFKLKTSEINSPLTGIKINYDGVNSYQDQSAFRFTIASSNAYLSNIEKSFYIDESEELTYTPIDNFDKENFEYENILNEKKDYISLIVSKEDEKSTVIAKIPKRDEAGNLVYSGETLEYEEKALDENNKINVKLNELGKEDTIIEFIVTAEDEETTNTYKIIIKRPFGTIKGSVQLGEGLRDSIMDSYGTYVEYIANVTVYERNVLDWEGIIDKTSSLDELDLIEYEAQSQSDKDDGSYELYVIPGEYDLIIERLGFLANVVKGITISENEVIDLENKILIEGDVDRSGIIDLDDIVTLVDVSDSIEGDEIYDIKYDFGQKGFVAIDDLVSAVSNSDNFISIEEY